MLLIHILLIYMLLIYTLIKIWVCVRYFYVYRYSQTVRSSLYSRYTLSWPMRIFTPIPTIHSYYDITNSFIWSYITDHTYLLPTQNRVHLIYKHPDIHVHIYLCYIPVLYNYATSTCLVCNHCISCYILVYLYIPLLYSTTTSIYNLVLM